MFMRYGKIVEIGKCDGESCPVRQKRGEECKFHLTVAKRDFNLLWRVYWRKDFLLWLRERAREEGIDFKDLLWGLKHTYIQLAKVVALTN